MTESKMLKNTVILAAVLIIMNFVSLTAQYAVGDTVADFSLSDLNGSNIALSDFSGKVILLNFFATW